MAARIAKGLAVLAALLAALFVTAGFLDTTERPAVFAPPGYLVTRIAVPGRSAPVRLHLWYPTEADSPASLIGQNGLCYGSHVRAGAAPAPGPHAVVVMSHGSGGNAERLGWLAGYLAHKGMIVATPDHPGTTSGDSDPFRTPLIWQRMDDLRGALDLLQSAPPAGLQPDMARIGVLGYSLGGYTVLGLGGLRVTKAAFIDHCASAPDAADCVWMVKAGVDLNTIDAARYDADHADRRISAVVAIDPALINAVNEASLATASRAFLLINLGDTATLLPGMDAAPLAARLPAATYQTIPGARHFSFLAECSTLGKIIIAVAGEDNICSDAGLRDRRIIHDEVRGSIGGFLAGHFGLAE